MSNPILSATALRKTFQDGQLNVAVLANLNLEVHAGECVAIMGASGSGKSTMLHCLSGLDQPTSGEVQVCGQDVFQGSERSRAQFRNQHLGFIYQFHHLLPEFDALENVMMPLLIAGMAYAKAKQQALAMIERVALSKRANHRINELSGGERQRIAIARALVNQPQCVFADEPTGDLDVASADHVTDLLLSLNEELGTAFIIVTHNEQLAQRMQRTLTLIDGCLVKR